MVVRLTNKKIQVLFLPHAVFTFTAVNEATYVIRFTCEGLVDVVCFKDMMTGYGCGEVPFFAHLGSDLQSQNPAVVGLLDCCLHLNDL